MKVTFYREGETERERQREREQKAGEIWRDFKIIVKNTMIR